MMTVFMPHPRLLRRVEPAMEFEEDPLTDRNKWEWGLTSWPGVVIALLEALKGKAPLHKLHSFSIVACNSSYDEFDRQSHYPFPGDLSRIEAVTSEHGLEEVTNGSLLLVGLTCPRI